MGYIQSIRDDLSYAISILYCLKMSSKFLFGIAVVLGFAAVSSTFAATGDTAASGAVVADSGATSGAYLSSLDINGEITVVSTDNTSITLAWDKVAAATSYIVFYDIKSPDANDPNATYSKMSDPVATTGATISGLTPNTTYYLMVLALDDKGNESSQGSKEVVAQTAGAAAFGLAENAVVTTSDKSLILSFNKKLDAAQPITLSIVANQDKSTVTATATVNATDASKVDVALDSSLVKDTSYTLTVKSATSAVGENVQAGVNAVQEFTFIAPAVVTPDITDTAVETVLKDIPLNAAPVATTTKALPETGPAENIVVALALILGAATVFVLRRRKA